MQLGARDIINIHVEIEDMNLEDVAEKMRDCTKRKR